MSIDSVGNAVRTVATNADSVQQTNTSPWDVMSHTADGLSNQSTADVVGRVVPAVGAGRAIAGMGEGVLEGGVHSSSLEGTAEGIEAQANVIGEQFSNFFSDDPKKNPEGVLANVGATFNLLTSVEQLWSMGFGMIPFPAFPALRVTDMDVGLPHAHSHPPNLTPPNPVPVPLPSTGPVIPIPLLSGASRTLINGLPAARCGDMGLGIWCGGYVPMFEVFLGSATVWIEGSRAGRMGVDITNHCIFSARPGDPPIGLFTGTTISGSPNTMIGGVPLPSMLSLGMGAMFRGLGGLLKKLKPKKLVQEAGEAADDVAEGFTRSGASARGASYAKKVHPGGNGKAIAGHGELRKGAGTFEVPEGTTLIVAKDGQKILDSTGRVMETMDLKKFANATTRQKRAMVTHQLNKLGIKNKVTRARVKKELQQARILNPGDVVENYTIKAPTDLNVHKASTMVEDATPLSELVKPNSGPTAVATCTEHT